jgi:gamma-butyrobetaine dioxygenase
MTMFRVPKLYRGVSLTPRRTWTSLTRTPENLTVHALNNATFPYIWLRDSCQSPKCVHPAAGHKLHCTSDIPLNIAPIEAESGVQVTDNGLEILWNDGWKSEYKKQWLKRYAFPELEEKFHWDDTFRMEHWTRDSLSRSPGLSFSYQEIMSSDEAVAKAIEQLGKYGLFFIRNAPHEETGDENCDLKRVVARFGSMRQTFYGTVWDVVKRDHVTNVALTDLELRLHQDLL